jgi:hypothetical protein
MFSNELNGCHKYPKQRGKSSGNNGLLLGFLNRQLEDVYSWLLKMEPINDSERRSEEGLARGGILKCLVFVLSFSMSNLLISLGE